MMRPKILISACLMGQAVRYDGQAKPMHHPAIERWKDEGRLVIFCPEMSAGMPVPRAPAEIESGKSAEAVLNGHATVLENTGRDVSAGFRKGAENALTTARANGCQHALLIDGSPSCGPGFIYDGSFTGKKISGAGVVATHLRAHGISVWAPSDIDRLLAELGEGLE